MLKFVNFMTMTSELEIKLSFFSYIQLKTLILQNVLPTKYSTPPSYAEGRGPRTVSLPHKPGHHQSRPRNHGWEGSLLLCRQHWTF